MATDPSTILLETTEDELPSYDQVAAGSSAGAGGAEVSPSGPSARFECNIWIGNLPPGFAEKDLQDLAGVYGSVASVKILAGRAGDFAGLVNFKTQEEADRAVKELDGITLHGAVKPLICKHSQGRGGGGGSRGGARGGRGGRGGGGPPSAHHPHYPSHPYHPTGPSSSSGAVNLWVGNVPFEFQIEDLVNLFAPYGNIVSAKIVYDKVTGQHKGAGLILYSSEEEAQAAMTAWNGVVLAGQSKPLVMKFAASRPVVGLDPAADAAGGPSAGIVPVRAPPARAPSPPPESVPQNPPAGGDFTNVWVGNLPLEFGESDLERLFSSCGEVVSVKIIRETKDPQSPSRGAGLVNFASPSRAAAALKLMLGRVLPGSDKPLTLKPAASGRSLKGGRPGPGPAAYEAHPPPMPTRPPAYGRPPRSGPPPHYSPGGYAPDSSRFPPPIHSPQPPAPPAGPPGGAAPFSESLWIGNLPLEFSEADLNTLFGAYGAVLKCTVIRDKVTGANMGAGLVKYGTVAQAVQAVSGLNGYVLDPKYKPLVVKFSSSVSRAEAAAAGGGPVAGWDVRGEARDVRDIRDFPRRPAAAAAPRYHPY